MMCCDTPPRPPLSRKTKLAVLPENPETNSEADGVGPGRFPKWLHRKMPAGGVLWETQEAVHTQRLATVCEEARCPNLLECWSQKTATFLAMGKTCTRNCGFCSIGFSKTPPPLEEDEPDRLADSVQALGLKHVVITMVARDDLPDGGASHLAKILKRLRQRDPTCTLEVLTSDFAGNHAALQTVLDAQPEIFNHNIETVASLTPFVRHKATYTRSLELLRYAHTYAPQCKIKSGLMLGLGESAEEVKEALQDLRTVGCTLVTLGQYLQADARKLRVKAFIPPAEFDAYAAYGKTLGFDFVFAGPFVRSSYHAADVFKQNVSASLPASEDS